MQLNQTPWNNYQPGYVDPLFVPYTEFPHRDKRGNIVDINGWKRQGGPQFINPVLVRKDWGVRFQRMFPDDPCPPGFDAGEGGYCYSREWEYEPVLFTSKAFIPKRQYWNGSTEGTRETFPRPSEQTDLRSVNPLDGNYTVYYAGSERNARTRYSQPKDYTWNLPRQYSYASMPTKDSLIA